MEETITFEYLYDVLRKEKYSKEIQRLDENFMANLKKYIYEKTQLLRSNAEKDSIFTASETLKTRKHIENVQKLVKELFERRESKILYLAFVASKNSGKHQLANNLQKEEEIMFNEIIIKLNEFRALTTKQLLSENPIELQKPKPMQGDLVLEKPKDIKTDEKLINQVIRVLEPVPQFVGVDMQVYGPFNEKDTVTLPIEIANVLINKNMAILENENAEET